jgi:hypothetical protein
MGIHQPRLAEKMAIPVFLSSLIQIPFISMMFGAGAQVGIITADSRNLTADLLKQVGVLDVSNLRIAGLEDRPQFYGFGIQETGRLDVDAVRTEVVETAEKLVAKHSGIRALLLECSLLPPYARSVQEAVNLPVFDYVTMIKYVFTGVVQQSYRGFL